MLGEFTLTGSQSQPTTIAIRVTITKITSPFDTLGAEYSMTKQTISECWPRNTLQGFPITSVPYPPQPTVFHYLADFLHCVCYPRIFLPPRFAIFLFSVCFILIYSACHFLAFTYKAQAFLTVGKPREIKTR